MPPGDGDLLLIPGEGDLDTVWKLAGSGQNFGKGKVSVEGDGDNTQKGGGGATGVHIFFKSVVQAVLLFRAETWVVPPWMCIVLGRFQDQVGRRLTGWLPRRELDGKWEYTSEAMARDEAIFQKMEEYIQKIQSMVA